MVAWAAPLLSHLIAVAHLPFLLSVFAVTYRRHGADCSPAIHRLFIVGNALIVAAFACWLLDRFACRQISAALPFYPQLHAWWHVLAYAAVWVGLIVGMYLRCLSEGEQARVVAAEGWRLPLLCAVPVEV